jgi:hypothetical protein
MTDLGIPDDPHTAYRLGLERANHDARTHAFHAIRCALQQARRGDQLAEAAHASGNHIAGNIIQHAADTNRRTIRYALGITDTP